ncbi:hypothetical protein CCYA_CCYA16G4187 [Cyanidiococcus yangmingshanensis]|nr:hypothetical protein CCYA_CCYA16G4187 [Cyanidiococcus yangmingshanensis]
MVRKRIKASLGFASSVLAAGAARRVGKLRTERRILAGSLVSLRSEVGAGTVANSASKAFSPWHVLPLPIEELDLVLCLQSGQTFRWRQRETGLWCGVHADLAWNLYRADSATLRYRYAPAQVDPEHARTLLRDFLQLDTGAPTLVELYREWSEADPYFKTVAPYLRGARVLRHDPVECLFSFLCSSNNHIRRISGMVEFLARRYGRCISASWVDNSDAYYAFPSVAQLATEATVDELRANGFGYRANFVVNTAKELLSRGGDKYLHALRLVHDREKVMQELVTLPGIGRKVASCIALLSLDCTDQVPVDTHVWQLTVRRYAPQWQTKSLTEKRYDEIGALFRERFGIRCGWAHQVLFTAELASFQERLPEALRLERSPGPKRRKVGAPAKARVLPASELE